MKYLSTLYVCDRSGDSDDGLPDWITHWECLHGCEGGDPAEAVHRVVTAFAHSAEGRALRTEALGDDTISYEEVLPKIHEKVWAAEGLKVRRRLLGNVLSGLIHTGASVILNGAWDLIPHGDEEAHDGG